MRGRRNTAYIGIGSNLGDRKSNVRKALGLVKMLKGVELTRISSIYETEPVGGSRQGNYLNGVFEIKTSMSPFGLLKEFKRIEKNLGRKKRMKNGPRTIDLDILLFGARNVQTKELTVPHPGICKREFVLRGLRELTRAGTGLPRSLRPLVERPVPIEQLK